MMTKRRLLPGLLTGMLMILTVPAWAGETNKYLPDDTEGIVTVNVQQMLQAPLIKNNLDTLKALLLAAGNVQKVFDDLGFDPFTDIDRVTVAIHPVPTKSLVLVQGKFDPAKITAKAEKAAKENGDILKIGKAGNHTVYEVKPPEQNETLYVAVLDSGTVAASANKETVVEALDKKEGTKKTVLKKELQALLAKVDPKQSIAVATLPGPLAMGGQPMVAKIKAITGGVTITDEVRAELMLNTKNAKDAEDVQSELKEGLDQLKALADLTANQNKDLKPLVDAMDTLKLTVEGSSVRLKGLLAKEVIDKLVPKTE